MDKSKGCKLLHCRFAILKFHGAISVFMKHLIEQRSSSPIFTVLTLMVQVYYGIYFSRIGALRIPTSENMQSSVRKISKTTEPFSRIRYLFADWHALKTWRIFIGKVLAVPLISGVSRALSLCFCTRCPIESGMT